jgi:hypothetical protein
MRRLPIPARVAMAILLMAALACILTHAPAHPTPRAVTAAQVRVYAHHGWQDTGIYIKAGNKVVIKYVSDLWFTAQADGGGRDASGGPNPWICDYPACHEPLHDFPKYALIGKIGEAAEIIKVGNKVDFVAESQGLLYLRPNYGDSDLVFFKPEGSIVVKITVK